MIKIDLITGLLGAGKTTFIAEYAKHLIRRGERICILANDYGAISIDRAFLLEQLGDSCDIEMVVAGDADCQRRRFRTKLISFAMLGYSRVLVEPSGVFDIEDFYNILYDEPISRWYQADNVISVVSADLPDQLSESSEYMLTDQASTAGLIYLSRTDGLSPSEIESAEKKIRAHLVRDAGKFHCTRDFSAVPMITRSSSGSEEMWDRIGSAGHSSADMVRMRYDEDGSFQNLFYFHINRTEQDMRTLVSKIFADPERFGHVIRIKGFFTDTGTGEWKEINSTSRETKISPSATAPGQQEEVLILVGEQMNEQQLGAAFGETKSVTDYSI